MAYFRVGMRVKLVKTLIFHSQIGKEFTVHGFGFWPKNGINRLVDCTVELNDGGVVAEWQIEPLVPPHEPCDTEFKQSLDRLLEKVGADKTTPYGIEGLDMDRQRAIIRQPT